MAATETRDDRLGAVESAGDNQGTEGDLQASSPLPRLLTRDFASVVRLRCPASQHHTETSVLVQVAASQGWTILDAAADGLGRTERVAD